MKINQAWVALLGTLLLSGTSVAAHAEASKPTVNTVSVQGSDSTLTISLNESVTAAEASEAKKSLQGLLDEGDTRVTPFAPDPGPKYPVVKCSQGNRTFTDRNGRFNVRYNCRYNNVNWGFRVSRKLVAIAAGPMKESGVTWYKGFRKLGKNAPHTVPVSYFLHGTQGRVASGDTLHWHDEMTFRVVVNGRPGTAVLRIGGSFVILR